MTRPLILLDGFPSSGTLKVQAALAHLMAGWIETLPELEAVIPEILAFDHLPDSSADFPANVLFTHHLPLPALLAHGVTKLIYVIRDPIDSAISIANWMITHRLDYGLATEDEIREGRLALIDFYLRNGTHLEFVVGGYGTWNVHALSWLQAGLPIPTMVIDFSDLKRRSEEIVRQMADFIGAPCSDEIVAGALRNWDIETTRRMEEDVIARKHVCRLYTPTRDVAYARGWRYHGSGGSNYGKDLLTAEQWEIAAGVFGPTCKMLGRPLQRRVEPTAPSARGNPGWSLSSLLGRAGK